MDFVFRDKENTYEPLRMAAKGSQNQMMAANTTRIQGKTFQDNVNKTDGTHRKILGDVNNTRNVYQGNGKAKRPLGSIGNTPAPAKKQNKRYDIPPELLPKPMSGKSLNQEKTNLQLQEEAKQKQEPRKRNEEDFDIEYMPPSKDYEDYDDVWSKSERPESWMPALANWRPASSFYFFEPQQETNVLEDAEEWVFAPAFESFLPDLNFPCNDLDGKEDSPPMPTLDDLQIHDVTYS